jgi:hypothetical protein
MVINLIEALSSKANRLLLKLDPWTKKNRFIKYRQNDERIEPNSCANDKELCQIAISLGLSRKIRCQRSLKSLDFYSHV